MSTQFGAGATESSVTFSLQELMKIEGERVAEQERDRVRQTRAKEEAARAAQHRAEQEQQARIATEQEQRRLQEGRARAETARLQALQNAILERERDQTQSQARLAEAELAHKHELAMEALRQDSSKRALKRRLSLVAAGATLLCGAGIFVQVGILQPEATERLAEANRRNFELQNDVDRLRRSIQTHSDSVEKLIVELQEAEHARALLAARLAEAERVGDKQPAVGAKGSVRPLDKPPQIEGPCRDDDPLCALNGRRLR